MCDLAEATEHYKVAADCDIAEAQCCLACIFMRKPIWNDGEEAAAFHQGTEISSIKTPNL